MKKKINLRNIKAYLQGKSRELFYGTRFDFLLRTHIKEQITWRLRTMDKQCKDNHACILCGCDVPALQMADKSCDKPCYPEMLDKNNWNQVKKTGYITRVYFNESKLFSYVNK